MTLRKRVLEEEVRKKGERDADKEPAPSTEKMAEAETPTEVNQATGMEVDDASAVESHQEVRDKHKSAEKDEPVPMQADDDDAVEY